MRVIFTTIVSFALSCSPGFAGETTSFPKEDLPEAMMMFGNGFIAGHAPEDVAGIMTDLDSAEGIEPKPARMGRSITSQIEWYDFAELAGIVMLGIGGAVTRMQANIADQAAFEAEIAYEGMKGDWDEVRRRVQLNPNRAAMSAKESWKRVVQLAHGSLRHHMKPIVEKLVHRTLGIEVVIRSAEQMQQQLASEEKLVRGELRVEGHSIDLYEKKTWAVALRECQQSIQGHVNIFARVVDEGVVLLDELTPNDREFFSRVDGIRFAEGLFWSDLPRHLQQADVELAVTEDAEVSAIRKAELLEWSEGAIRRLQVTRNAYQNLLGTLEKIQLAMEQLPATARIHQPVDDFANRAGRAKPGLPALNQLVTEIEESGAVQSPIEPHMLLNDLERALADARQNLRSDVAEVTRASHSNFAGSLTKAMGKVKAAKNLQPPRLSGDGLRATSKIMFAFDGLLALNFAIRLTGRIKGWYLDARMEQHRVDADDFAQSYVRHLLDDPGEDEEFEEDYNLATALYYDHYLPLVTEIYLEAFPDEPASPAGSSTPQFSRIAGTSS